MQKGVQAFSIGARELSRQKYISRKSQSQLTETVGIKSSTISSIYSSENAKCCQAINKTERIDESLINIVDIQNDGMQ